MLPLRPLFLIQIVARFSSRLSRYRHLLRNGSDALRGLLDQHHRELREAARAAAQPAGPSASATVPKLASPAERPMRTTERRSQAAQERRDARFAEVARLREQGLSLKAIARTIGIERRTVRRWLRAGPAPTWRPADRGTSILDPYKAWLDERWQSGCNNAAALWRELQDRGFPGQYTVVRDWATQRRRQNPPAELKQGLSKPVLGRTSEPP